MNLKKKKTLNLLITFLFIQYLIYFLSELPHRSFICQSEVAAIYYSPKIKLNQQYRVNISF